MEVVWVFTGGFLRLGVIWQGLRSGRGKTVMTIRCGSSLALIESQQSPVAFNNNTDHEAPQRSQTHTYPSRREGTVTTTGAQRGMQGVEKKGGEGERMCRIIIAPGEEKKLPFHYLSYSLKKKVPPLSCVIPDI